MKLATNQQVRIIAEITRSGEYEPRPGRRHLGIVIPFIG